jgi:hypothetical protein
MMRNERDRSEIVYRIPKLQISIGTVKIRQKGTDTNVRRTG